MSRITVLRLFRSRNACYTTVLAKWSLLVVLLLSVKLASPRNRAEASGAGMRLCGAKLVKMVTAICKGCVQGTKMEPVKRNLVSDRMKAFELALSPEKRNDLWRDERAFDTFGNSQRQTRRTGIATECCENMCTYSYLKSFCCNPS